MMSIYSGLFRKYLISYLVILTIPSLAGYLSYRTSIAVTQSISIENSVTLLQNSKTVLERRMAEVEGFTRQLALNQDLSVLMSNRSVNRQSDLYSIWRFTKSIVPFSQTNDFLQQFYIYLNNYDAIVSPGNTYFNPDHFYQNYSYAELSLEEWKDQILRKNHKRELMPMKRLVHQGAETPVITYMQSLPLDSFDDTARATVVVIIDDEQITELLSGLTARYGGWAAISDEQGRTISLRGIGETELTRLSNDARMDVGKTSQFYGNDLVITIHADNGWIYRAGIPKEALLRNANRIKHISWSVTGAALIIGLIVGLFLAYRNSMPINRLLAALREQFGRDDSNKGNDYDFLHGNISKIITSNKLLEAELQRQMPLIRDAFYKRLIAGEFPSQDAVDAAAKQAGLDVAIHPGIVGILHMNGYSEVDDLDVLQELSAARLLVKKELQEADATLLVTDLGADRIVVLFVFSEESSGEEEQRKRVQSNLDEWIPNLHKRYKISVTAVLGNPYADPTNISQSYYQALQTMESAVYMNQRGVYWYRDAGMESATYYYPLEMELKLIGLIRSGEMPEAEELIRSILNQNAERDLSIEMKHQLVGEIKGTFLKLLDQKGLQDNDLFEELKNRMINIETAETIQMLERDIASVLDMLGSLMTRKKNDAHARTIERIKEFVTERYSDAELTLYQIAEHVERPEKTISQLFKEHTGTNLSDYIEQIRMDRASALLRDPELTVDEIASRVGYNSSHSFRRAFKRVTGVTPSVFRHSFGL